MGVVVWISCAHSSKQPHSLSPHSLDRASLHRVLKDRAEGLLAVRGKGRFLYGAKPFRRQGEVVILVQRPLNFRFDLPSEFGLLAHQVVSDGGLLTVIWHPENRYFQGVGTAEQVSRYLSFALSPEKLIPLLLAAPLPENKEEYEVRPLKDGGVFLKGILGDIWLKWEGEELVPRKVVLKDLSGKAIARIDYQEFEWREGWYFPRKLRGMFGTTRVDLVWDEWEINPSLSRSLFDVEIPRDATRIYE